MAKGPDQNPEQWTADRSSAAAGIPGDSLSPDSPPAGFPVPAGRTPIRPPWLGVLLSAWIGTICGGMLFGLLIGLMPFLFLGLLAAITGFYGAILGLALTAIVSLPLSLLCTGVVRMFSPEQQTRGNYIIAAAVSGFLSGFFCFIGIWEVQLLALLPGLLGAGSAAIAVLITARNELVSGPAPPPVSTWGDLDE